MLQKAQMNLSATERGAIRNHGYILAPPCCAGVFPLQQLERFRTVNEEAPSRNRKHFKYRECIPAFPDLLTLLWRFWLSEVFVLAPQVFSV